LPRGSFTEICGLPCAGCTTLLISALATLTEQSEVCALVDGRDAFDPYSAEAAGVKLNNLLWVRCRNMDQSLRATDLLLQGGGFGMVVLDLSDIPVETVRHVPLNVWFRFQRAVEDTTTILLLLERGSNAKTCASLVLRLGTDSVHWKTTREPDHPHRQAFANLLAGSRVRAEVLRSRTQPITTIYARDNGAPTRVIHSAKKPGTERETIFEAKAIWSYPDRGFPAKPAPK
jgi:hypothetical protein